MRGWSLLSWPSEGARVANVASARPGTTLAASPPRVTKPWARLEMLPQQPHCDLTDRQRVTGIDTELRGHRRVGSAAVHPIVALIAGERRKDVPLARCWMHHHRRVHPIERTALHHQDLAAARLLRWRAVDPHRETQLVG